MSAGAGAVNRALLLLVMLTGCDEVNLLRPDAGPDGGPPSFDVIPLPPAPDGAADPVNLFAVGGSSAKNVVFVGSGGTILRWNGTALSREDAKTNANLRGVAVVSDEIAWAVGEDGTVVRWNGQRWTVQEPGTTAHLNAVYADAGLMIAVGVKGAAVAFDAVWRPVATDSPDDLYAIAGSPQGIFAVGALGTLAKWDGKSALKRMAVPNYSKTLAGATVGKGGSFIVGVGGGVFRADNLQAIVGAPPVFLRGVTAPGPDVWVAGFDGVVAKYVAAEKKWTVFDDVPARWYQAIFAAAPDDVWVAGNAGILLRSRVNAAPPDGGAADAKAPSDGGGAG